jgi:hypothetical protein
MMLLGKHHAMEIQAAHSFLDEYECLNSQAVLQTGPSSL